MNHVVVSAASSDTGKKVVNVVLLGVGGYIAYRIVKKVYENMRKSAAEHNAGEDPHVRIAMGLRAAMNPSGMSWMRSFDTTNVSKMYEYAGQITNLSAVQSAYKDLYQDNLMDDVQKELNNNEYQRFMTLVTSNNNLVNASNSGTTSSTAVKYANAGDIIVAKAALNVRSSPKGNYNGGLHEILEPNKNIIRTVKKGDFIGIATGRQEFDVANNIKFIEVGYSIGSNIPEAVKKLIGGFQGEVRHWVSSSAAYVDKFPTKAKALAAYPNISTLLSYLQPPSGVSLKGIADERTPTVITTANSIVMDGNMQPIISIQPNVMLGECLMVLSTNSSQQLVKFRTVQGAERWIDSQTVKIIEL